MIDVLIAARNEQETLGATLRSLASQTAACRMIVVDNASTDGTAQIARDGGATVVSCTPRGKLPCLRLGFKVARSPIVAIADADTLYPDDWLARIVCAFESAREIHIVYGPSRMGHATISTLASRAFVRISLALGAACAVGYNLAVRREALGEALSSIDNVAGSGWAIATSVLRTHGRRAVCYREDLVVPKNPRRYEAEGTWRLWRIWAFEWLRLVLGRDLAVRESTYYHFVDHDHR